LELDVKLSLHPARAITTLSGVSSEQIWNW